MEESSWGANSDAAAAILDFLSPPLYTPFCLYVHKRPHWWVSPHPPNDDDDSLLKGKSCHPDKRFIFPLHAFAAAAAASPRYSSPIEWQHE